MFEIEAVQRAEYAQEGFLSEIRRFVRIRDEVARHAQRPRLVAAYQEFEGALVSPLRPADALVVAGLRGSVGRKPPVRRDCGWPLYRRGMGDLLGSFRSLL